MKIYVVGSSKDKFLKLDNIREKFLVDAKHDIPNIDFLNPWYCELTGLYHLWQHVDDEIVGLEHYRTYFWKNGHPITEQEIKNELKKGDITISGYKYPWNKHNVLEQELDVCVKGSLSTFLKVLTRKDAGLAKYFKKFLKGQRLYACNCFIGPYKILDEWAEFLFDLLIEFEQISKIGPATDTLRREGYFAEFLFGAWLEYKGYKPVIVEIKKFSKNFKLVEQHMFGPDKRVRLNER